MVRWGWVVATVAAACTRVGPPLPQSPESEGDRQPEVAADPEVWPVPVPAPDTAATIPERALAPPALAPPLVGVMLPSSGSPLMRQYATLIEEGIRAAVASLPDGDVPPVLRVIDTGRGAEGWVRDLSELEGEGLSVLVGPLRESMVAEIAGRRRRPVPMITPLSQVLPEGHSGVYSLAGSDPAPATALARYAWENGLRRVVAVAPSTPEARFEVEVFASGFRVGGGILAGALYYPPGQTDFRAQIAELTRIDPDGILLPLPPPPAADIPQLAGQVRHYGRGQASNVMVLGTAAWSAPEVLSGVDASFTNDVLTVTAGSSSSPAYDRFVRGYETVHQKSLRSEVPALGWDLVGLLMEAFRTGARSAEETHAALEAIEGFQGATGTLSVEDGRITRAYEVVVIRNRELVRLR